MSAATRIASSASSMAADIAHRRACPVCEGTDARLLYENSLAKLGEFDFSSTIRACNSCGAAYAGETLEHIELERYYSTLSKYDTPKDIDGISTLDKARAAAALQFLLPHLSRFETAIEIGSSVGYLLHLLKQGGIKSVCGLDPAPAAAEAGRRLFGITIEAGFAESFADYKAYDLVCLRAVLEHLLQPQQIMHAVGRQLRPGAHLFVEVPDAGAFDRPEGDADFEPFGEFSNEHINFFAINDLCNLASRAGLVLVGWRSFRVNGLPGLFALLRREDAPALMPAPDSHSAPTSTTSSQTLQRYIEASQRRFGAIEARLRAIQSRDVLIYGAGNHTLRMLARSAAIRDHRVLAVVDRNPNYRGISVGGIEVVPPAAIAHYPDAPLIISSYNARREIETALRSSTSRPLIQLYD